MQLGEATLSEEEWKLVKVDVGGDVSNLTSIDGNLVSQHARGRNLDWIGPVVIVVAQGISEVKDCILRNQWSILSHIEVSRLYGTLGHIVRHKEKVEFTINYFGLLNKTLINVSAWRRVQDLRASFFEESLSDSFIHDDEGDLRSSLIIISLKAIFISDNLFKLF